MKEIKLTMGLTAVVDDADFEWLNQWRWCTGKQGKKRYAVRRDSVRPSKKLGTKSHISMHRLILGLTDSKILTDHRDGNGLNNCRDNLRAATRSQNSSNRSSKIGGSSKYLGVTFNKDCNKWRAEIYKNRKAIRIGYFNNEEDAAMAYNTHAMRLHGEFARLNQIP